MKHPVRSMFASGLPRAIVLSAGLVAGGLGPAAATEELFQSRQITPAEYTRGIEGPAVGPDGSLYAVNFIESGTIGRLRPGAAQTELFARLPGGGIGNGLRFDRDGRMYVADYKLHKVYVIEPGDTVPQVYFASDLFHQPNDLAIARDGTLYLSDPDFKNGTGRIWQVRRGEDGLVEGKVLECGRTLGVPNGLDLSPDDATLYVSEPNTRQVWAYRVSGDRLTAPRLVWTFGEFELDGLRTDERGAIFVTRPGAGKVAMLAPKGRLLREIPTAGKIPSNLTFGGADGRTVYVTQADGGFVESFRAARRGREPGTAQ